MSCLSTAQISKMLDAITGYCGNAPNPVKIHTVTHTVERFCRDIGGIKTHLGPVPMNHANGIYFAVAPFGGVVFDVRCVLVNFNPLDPSVYRVFYRDDGRASVTIPYGTHSGHTLEMDVCWRPGERTTQMPEQWFDKHFDTIMHGSIAAILSQVNTAWANPDLAAQFEMEYSRDVQDCIAEARIAEAPNGKLTMLDPGISWI